MSSGPKAYIDNVYKRSPFNFPPPIKRTNKKARFDQFSPESVGQLIPDVSAGFPPSAVHREKLSLDAC